MRNLLDTASVAQSLDGARLMGRLHYPDKRIFLDLSDYKDGDLQRAMGHLIGNDLTDLALRIKR